MKEFVVYILLSSFFILASCESHQAAPPDGASAFLDSSADNIITLLFSDDDHIDDENSYFNALLDFKKDYPDLIGSIDIVNSEDNDLRSAFNIQSFPALLVIDNSEVVVQVEGAQTSNTILNLLEEQLDPE
jgi:hypothetical protein